MNQMTRISISDNENNNKMHVPDESSDWCIGDGVSYSLNISDLVDGYDYWTYLFQTPVVVFTYL